MKVLSTSLIKLSLAALLLVASQNVFAQTVYSLTQNTAVEIKVLGKSTADDRLIATASIEGQGEFKFDGENLDDITSFNFNLSAQNLECKKSAAVNKRAYKVLNATKNPTISYKVNCATVTPGQKGKYGIILGGELTVGNVTQLKCMLLSATMNDDSTLTLTGNTYVQLNNDDLKSPKFMEGPVNVNDDLAIQFTFIYKKNLIQDTPIHNPHKMLQDYITQL